MNKMREVRARIRISQFRLALETGIVQSKISLIENGLVQPSTEEKLKFAKALEVPVEELFPTSPGEAAPDKKAGD
jgi:DNA-binding XRE family transcriptional regulator